MKVGFIEIFQAMNAEERTAFVRYVHSFYGNQKVAIRALEYIKDQISLDSRVDEVKLFAHTFPNLIHNFNNKHIKNTLSDLKIYLHEFIIWLEVKSKPKKYPLILTNWFQSRKLFLAQQQYVIKAKKEFDLRPGDSFWTISTEYHLHHYLYFNAPEDVLSKEEKSLSVVWQLLNRFYITSKLIYACEALNRRQILGDKSEYKLEDLEVEKLLYSALEWEQHSETIKIYKEILILMTTNRLDSFHKLKNIIIDPHVNISSENYNAIILYILNFASKAYRDGRTDMDYKLELFLLYKIGLSSGAFILNGFIPLITFQNIVNLSCSLRKIEWANQFIIDYAIFLNHEEGNTKNLINISLSRVQFELKNFENTLELLSLVSPQDTPHDIHGRVLEVMCYYEMKSELLPYKIDALSMYLYRTRNKYQILVKSTINFIRILKSIYYMSLTIRNDRGKRVGQLKLKLEVIQPIAFKEWLHEKIDEITT